METTKPIVGQSELILICLVIVGLLAIVARRIRVPYPILLTISGVLLGLIPTLPVIHLAPELESEGLVERTASGRVGDAVHRV